MVEGGLLKTPAFYLATFALLCTAPVSQAVSLISLTFDAGVTIEQRQVFNAAAGFLNSAITGYDLIYDGDGNLTPHGLSISVSIPAIDGPFGVLGGAGPNTVEYFDNNPLGAPTRALYYASTGSMEFDSADVPALLANNSFYSVVLHEMLHVLGVGTLWTPNNNVNGTTYPLYSANSGMYTGAAALAAWRTEFGQPGATSVPVELGGGAGTANGHWNEVDFGGGNTGITSNLTGLDFRQELMTGWASSSFFLSTVTLGGLDDLGYQVDYSKAGLITYVPEPGVVGLCLMALGLAWRRGGRGRLC
jgi:Leishmanolysin